MTSSEKSPKFPIWANSIFSLQMAGFLLHRHQCVQESTDPGTLKDKADFGVWKILSDWTQVPLSLGDSAALHVHITWEDSAACAAWRMSTSCRGTLQHCSLAHATSHGRTLQRVQPGACPYHMGGLCSIAAWCMSTSRGRPHAVSPAFNQQCPVSELLPGQ